MADKLSAAMLADPADHKTGRLFLNTADRIHRLSASFGLNPGDRNACRSISAKSKRKTRFSEVARGATASILMSRLLATVVYGLSLAAWRKTSFLPQNRQEWPP